jgi:hypothetical protein
VKTAACLSVEEEMNRIARNSYAENGKCVRFFGNSLFCFRESIDVDDLISANAKHKTGAPQAQTEKLSYPAQGRVQQRFASCGQWVCQWASEGILDMVTFGF